MFWKPSHISEAFFLGVASPFFSGILLSRKPPKTLNGEMAGF